MPWTEVVVRQTLVPKAYHHVLFCQAVKVGGCPRQTEMETGTFVAPGVVASRNEEVLEGLPPRQHLHARWPQVRCIQLLLPPYPTRSRCDARLLAPGRTARRLYLSEAVEVAAVPIGVVEAK